MNMTTDHRQHLTGESPPQQRRLLLHTQARSFCIALFLCLHLLSQFFPLVAEPMLPAAFPASSSSRCFFCVACLEMAPNGKILRRSLGVLKQQYLKRKAVIREERTKLVGMMETIKEKEAALDEMIAERSPSFTSGSSLFGSSSDSEGDGENAAAKSVKPKGPNPTPPPPPKLLRPFRLNRKVQHLLHPKAVRTRPRHHQRQQHSLRLNRKFLLSLFPRESSPVRPRQRSRPPSRKLQTAKAAALKDPSAPQHMGHPNKDGVLYSAFLRATKSGVLPATSFAVGS